MKMFLKILAVFTVFTGIVVVSWGQQSGWMLIGFGVLALILATT